MADKERQETHEHGHGPEPSEEVADAPQSPQEAPADAGSAALSDALKSSFRFLKIAMVALVVIYLLTGIFFVAPNEVKFKLRFGKVVGMDTGDAVLRSGKPHLRWPWETVQEVTIDEKSLEVNSFWGRSTPDGKLAPTETLDLRQDGYLISGDANVVHAKMRVRYTVRTDGEGVVAYKFFVDQPEQILQRCAQNAAVRVVAGRPVMNVLNREAVFEAIELQLKQNLREFEEHAGTPLGVEVVAVEAVEQQGVKNPSEPGAVSRAFFNAQDAVNKRHSLEEEGRTRANTILEEALARREEIIAEAKGHAVRLVRSARADAQQMEDLLPIYNRSPEERNILLEDYYQRAFVEVLENAPGAMFLRGKKDGRNHELRILLKHEESRRPEEDEQS